MPKGKQIPEHERSSRRKMSYTEATVPVLEGDGPTPVYYKKYAVRPAASGDGFEVFEPRNGTVAAKDFPTRGDANDWMDKNVAP
jgi:hypothetical protein